MGDRGVSFWTAFVRVLCFCSMAALSVPAQAYILPGEQVVALMTENFSALKSLVIIQSREMLRDKDQVQGRVCKERIWLQSPDLFAWEWIGGPGGEGEQDNPVVREVVPNRAFRQLVMANTEEAILNLLSAMGINPESVGYTRLEGLVAYRIGEMGPQDPVLVIDKARFLPLLLRYRVISPAGPLMVAVRFHDYRDIDGAWYPSEVTYVCGDREERFSVLDMEANVPIHQPLSKMTLKWDYRPLGHGDADEEAESRRLREVIQILRDKYR